MLPFHSPLTEYHELPELGRVPKFGCLTLEEHLTMDGILSPSMRDLLSNPLASTAIAQSLYDMMAQLLLVSRAGKRWTAELYALFGEDERAHLPELPYQVALRIIAKLRPDTRRQMADFLLNERNRWGKAPQSKSTDSTPIDWGEVFWRLQAAYPNDPRFTEERFAKTPILVIEGALQALHQRELISANTAATPIALMASVLSRPYYKKPPELDWFNPYSKALKRQAAKARIPTEVAKLFERLSKEHAVPSWVPGVVNVDELQLAAED